MNIGKSVHIKGELNGNEDLTIDGTVEGKIVLSDHNLTIGSNAKITAEVSAMSVVVVGHVIGDVRAQEKIEVKDGGTVEGDLIAPKVVLAEGARFKGSIDMLSSQPQAPRTETRAERRPEPPDPGPEPEPETTPSALSIFDEKDEDEEDYDYDEVPSEVVEDIVADVIDIDENFEEKPAWAPDDDEGDEPDSDDEDDSESDDEEETKASNKLAGMFDEFDPSDP